MLQKTFVKIPVDAPILQVNAQEIIIYTYSKL